MSLPRNPLANLSVGQKLVLSVCVTFLLICAMVALTGVDLSRQARLAEQEEQASAASHAVSLASLAASRMRVDGQSILLAQDGGAVAAPLDSIAQERDTASKVIADLMSGAEPDQVRRLRDAEEKVAALGTALTESGKLRRRVLEVRDGDFLTLHDRFADQGSDAASGIRDLPDGVRDDVNRTLVTYEAAIGDLRITVLRYLATGDDNLVDAADRASVSARTLVGVLTSFDVPAELRTTLVGLAQTGGKLSTSSKDLFKATAALDTLVDGTITPLCDQVAASMLSAEAAYTRATVSAAAEAGRGRLVSLRHLLALAASVALLVAVSGWFTARAISRPLRAMTTVIERMAAGDTNGDAGLARRRDEIGKMAAAIEVLRGVLRQAFLQSQMIEQMPLGVMTARDGVVGFTNEAMRRLLSVAGAVPPDASPDGRIVAALAGSVLETNTRLVIGSEHFDVAVSALHDRAGALDASLLVWRSITDQARLAETFERSVGGIAREVGDAASAMSGTAQAMDQIATDAGMRAEQVQDASNRASVDVQSAVATVEQMSASVSEIARQVAESARMATQAVAEARETDRVIGGLSDAARAIGDVVHLISDIASRTNLLALNATIEAARAGEAGRGFAVVAGEVKALASQTAKATEQISGQIAGMRTETEQAVRALRSIGATIEKLDAIAAGVAGVIQEQDSATREIARTVQGAAQETANVGHTMIAVSEAVGRTRVQSGEVLNASSALGGQASRLRDEVDRFLSRIRAA